MGRRKSSTTKSTNSGATVGYEAQEDDGEPFDEKMQRLTAEWRKQVKEARRLDVAIEENLRGLGYGD